MAVIVNLEAGVGTSVERKNAQTSAVRADYRDTQAAVGPLPGSVVLVQLADAAGVLTGEMAAMRLDHLSLVAFGGALADLPTSPDGLPVGALWKQGDAAGGYFIMLAGTNT